MKLWLDLETFSETPLRNGTSRYAEGSEVLLSAFALDGDPVEVVEGWPRALNSLANSAEKIVIHNARFDRTILKHHDTNLDLSKVHCTQAQARSVGLPGALDKLCDILGVPLDKAKEKQGKQLIQLFCKPLPANRKERRATKKTHPVEWDRFVDYCRLDVEAMREVYKRLPTWNYTGFERALWELDQKINDRGFAIDLDLARAAIEAVSAQQKALGKRTVDLTQGEVESTNQRDALLKHLLEQCGVSLPDMQKGTLERRLNDENLPDAARELIAIRLEASSTSVAKYQALVNATSSDGRLRGALEFCGASRTGRWSGRQFQPQNLVRTPDWFTPDVQATTVEAIKSDVIDLVAEDPIKQISYCCRGAVIAPPGKKLVVADLANIEGRVLAWLAGEEWKLEAFRAYDAGIGPDLYKLTYSRAFNVADLDSIGKEQRQLGKVMELALGYEGGVGAFVTFVHTYNMDLDHLTEMAYPLLSAVDRVEAEGFLEWTKQQGRPTFGLSDKTFVTCDALKRAWRKAHPATVALWKDLKETVQQAICEKEKTFTVGRLRVRRDGTWLRVVLPSGRALCYASPKIEDDGQISYRGINQYTKQWSRLRTYGGKLIENVDQATSRDILAHAMPLAEAAGYPIVMHVHDELVTEVPDEPTYTADGLVGIMTTNPVWADGLPLAAEGEEMRRYRK